jgi:uncharacterized OB-fold protein
MPYVPIPDADSRSFWAAAAAGRLLIQRCPECEEAQFFPRPSCIHCQGSAVVDEYASGRAAVHSFTIVRRAPSRDLADRVPYVVALVDLDEGVRMMTNVVDCDPDDVSIGMEVEATFQRLSDDITLPLFRPVLK